MLAGRWRRMHCLPGRARTRGGRPAAPGRAPPRPARPARHWQPAPLPRCPPPGPPGRTGPPAPAAGVGSAMQGRVAKGGGLTTLRQTSDGEGRRGRGSQGGERRPGAYCWRSCVQAAGALLAAAAAAGAATPAWPRPPPVRRPAPSGWPCRSLQGGAGGGGSQARDHQQASCTRWGLHSGVAAPSRGKRLLWRAARHGDVQGCDSLAASPPCNGLSLASRPLSHACPHLLDSCTAGEVGDGCGRVLQRVSAGSTSLNGEARPKQAASTQAGVTLQAARQRAGSWVGLPAGTGSPGWQSRPPTRTRAHSRPPSRRAAAKSRLPGARQGALGSASERKAGAGPGAPADHSGSTSQQAGRMQRRARWHGRLRGPRLTKLGCDVAVRPAEGGGGVALCHAPRTLAQAGCAGQPGKEMHQQAWGPGPWHCCWPYAQQHAPPPSPWLTGEWWCRPAGPGGIWWWLSNGDASPWGCPAASAGGSTACRWRQQRGRRAGGLTVRFCRASRTRVSTRATAISLSSPAGGERKKGYSPKACIQEAGGY